MPNEAPPYDLRGTMEYVGRRLPEAGVDVLLIGGFAVNYYGYTRSTLDVDFMIAADDVTIVKEKMMEADYSNYAIHEAVAFFQQPDTSLRIDFLRVERSTVRQLKNRAERIKVTGIELWVPSLPDLIAMKLFAVHHGVTERRDKDVNDVVQLVVKNDFRQQDDLKTLCEQYASSEVYEELCQRIHSMSNR